MKPEAAEVYDCMGTGGVHLLPGSGRWSRGEQAAGQTVIRTVCLLHCPLTCLFEHFKSRWIQTTYLSHFLVSVFILFLAPRLCNKVHWGPGRISPHCPPCHLTWGKRCSSPPGQHQPWLSAWKITLPSLWVWLVEASVTYFSLELWQW